MGTTGIEMGGPASPVGAPWGAAPVGAIPAAREAAPETPSDEAGPVVDADAAARQQRRVTLVGYAGLMVVVGITAAMSWKGLLGFARDVAGMEGLWAYGVPVSLDIAAMVAAFLSLRSIISHDSAAGPRLLTFLLVAGSAAANYFHAATEPGGGTAAAMYFGAMSIVTWWLWEVVLRQIRRSVLRSIGAVEKPIARFRIVRWLRFPRETFRAWSESVRHGLTRPEEALEKVWSADRVEAEEKELRELERLEQLPDGISKKQAIEMAFKALGELDVPAAVAWCSERGLEVNLSYAYELARKTEPRALEAV